MRKEALNAAFFFLVLIVLLVLGFMVLAPVLDFTLFGFLLAIGFWPMRQGVRRVIHSDRWAAFLTLLIAAILVILPMVLIAISLLDDARSFVARIEPGDFEGSLRESLHLPETGASAAIADIVFPHILSFLSDMTQDLAQVLARLAIGLMVLAFVLYYAFAEGPRMVQGIKSILPLKSVYKDRLIAETRNAVHAIFFGQLLISVGHGFVLGIAFWLFGIPNPVVWGFVAIIVSILPAIGTPALYIPAAIYLLIRVGQLEAILMLVWGVVLSTGLVEYWWRLRLIKDMAQIHPLLVLIGVVGGIGAFGMAGFIFGPLILALLIVFMRVFSETYDEDPNYLFL